MAKTDLMRCQLITPDRRVFDMETDSVIFPAHDGEVGILKNRAPLLHKLGIGICRVGTGQTEKRYYLDGGFAHMLNNTLTMLTEDAQGQDEIDAAEVEEELAKAEALPGKSLSEIEERSKAILRAKTKLQLARRR